MLADVYCASLTLEGYDCTAAYSFDSGLDAINKYKSFDFAVIDIILKPCGVGKNGIKLREAICTLSPQTKTVLISGFSPEPIDPHIKYVDKISPEHSTSFVEETLSKIIYKWENWDAI